MNGQQRASRDEDRLTDYELLVLFNRNPMYARYMYLGENAEFASICLYVLANPVRSRQ